MGLKTAKSASQRRIPTEDEEQEAVVEYCDHLGIPVFHIPNGGLRHKSVAVHMKRLGVKAGVPDLFIPLPMGKFHGLFIEMKRTKGWQVSDSQKEWIIRLKKNGYAAYVCPGADSAINCIEQYTCQ